MDNDTVLSGSNDKIIRKLSLERSSNTWQPIAEMQEESLANGGYANSPCCMIFNPDSTLIAIAYRGFPLSVWDLNDATQPIGRCHRMGDDRAVGTALSFSGVDRVSWNPRTSEIVGLYNDGCVFKWDPQNDSTSGRETSYRGVRFGVQPRRGSIRYVQR